MASNAAEQLSLGAVRGEDRPAPPRVRDKGAAPAPTDAVARDRAARSGATPADALGCLRYAQQKSGRRPMELVREYFRLSRGIGKLSLSEYVRYGVYDTTRYDRAAQSRFLNNVLHWPITGACCDMTWQATTEDKWLCARILADAGVRVPETMAVIDRGNRAYPGTPKISTAAELRALATRGDALPLFGKENRGTCSFGAFLAEGADATGLSLKGHGAIAYEAFLDSFVGSVPYLLQRVEINHPFFDRYTTSLATVRACILMGAGGVNIPFAVLKLPSRDNVADSFWRPGNLACNLDLATGRIVTARSQHPYGTTDHPAHPETGAALLGEQIPCWDAVLDLARSAAPIFAPVRYQSMDIAITTDGPVLIEINTGGGFDLPQLASGEGFLTDEVRAFFTECGYWRR